MPSFFIDRPIFAWVVALFICLIGAISIPLLAVAQYPIIAPPSISISTSYPGASPENLYNSVTRLIEEELNGASGILNFESTSELAGAGRNHRQLRARHRNRRGLGRSAEPPQARRGAAAARGDPAGHPGRGSLLRRAADHHAELDRRHARRNRPRRFHDPQRARRNQAHSRRRPRHALFDRTFAADLDRSRKARRLRSHRRRRQQGDNSPERAGRLRQHRRRAEHAGAEDFRAGAGQGPARLARGIRRDHAARQSGRLDRAAARRRAHRDRRPELPVQHAPQRQADRGPFGAAVADRQRARDRQRRRSQDEGTVEVLPGQYRLRNPLQHHARRQGLDQQGADDAGRGGGAGLHRDVPVPAEHPLHHHSDHRGAGGAARHLRDADGGRLFHQHADDVRHGAGGRHPRRRRHRRGRERRAHHGGGGPAAEGSDPQGDVADHQRHHRHHAGADGGVRADGVLPGIGRHHLPPVLGHHGVRHRLLRAAGAVADAGAVRDAAEAGRSRPWPCAQGRVRLVQPRAGVRAAAAIRAP